jgi:hypothetical protein
MDQTKFLSFVLPAFVNIMTTPLTAVTFGSFIAPAVPAD